MKKMYVAAGVILMAGMLVVGTGCETDAQSGALGGAALGALAGQAIGGNTSSTLIGMGVGTGVGYMVGNERDKQQAQQISTQTRSTNYSHPEVGALGGTRWKVVSLAPASAAPPYVSKIVEFRPDAHVVTTTTDANGNVTVERENYRVVGSALIINRPGYIVNSTYAVQGNQLVIDAEEFRAVLQRI